MRDYGRKLNVRTGQLSLTPQMEDFLDWLCGDNPGETQNAYAERVGVSRATLHRWKTDPSFLRAWQDRMIQTHAHPETLSKQLKALGEKAETGDVKAIELYWRLIDRMAPERVELSGPAVLSELTDEEFAERMLQAAESYRPQLSHAEGVARLKALGSG